MNNLFKFLILILKASALTIVAGALGINTDVEEMSSAPQSIMSLGSTGFYTPRQGEGDPLHQDSPCYQVVKRKEVFFSDPPLEVNRDRPLGNSFAAGANHSQASASGFTLYCQRIYAYYWEHTVKLTGDELNRYQKGTWFFHFFPWVY